MAPTPENPQSWHNQHRPREKCIDICMYISLRDIQFMPTRSEFTFFQTLLNFWSNAPKCRYLRGGMCMLFEICEKRPFQKCMGRGG